MIDVTKENTRTLLNQELSKLVCDLVSELPAAGNTPNFGGLYNLNNSQNPDLQQPESPSRILFSFTYLNYIFFITLIFLNLKSALRI